MAGYYDIALGGVRSPGFVAAEMRTVDAAVRALGIDVQQVAAQLPPSFMPGWIAFRVEWAQFYKDNSGWLDRATNPVYDKTIEFRERYASWRDQFVRAGGTPSVPALPKEKKPISPAVLLVGAGVVSLALWYIFKVDHSE